MKLSKNTRFLVRVRDYEVVHIEVGSEVTHFDLGYDDLGWATLPPKQRDSEIEHLHSILSVAVEEMAREELEIVGQWSEFSPNVAEDFLSHHSASASAPLPLKRKDNATDKKTDSPTTGRRLRGG